MIKAEIYYTEGKITGFFVRNHSDYDVEGSDIVCAAVSALVYSALGTIDELVKEVDYIEDEEEVVIGFNVPENCSKKDENLYNIILKNLEIGLMQIENQYDEYLEVEIKEV